MNPKNFCAGLGGLGLGLCALLGAARAESPMQDDPPFHNLRYRDDFSGLAGKSETSLWEKWKYIPLGDTPSGPIYLSLGGEIRERYETYQHPNFGIVSQGVKPPPSDGYLLERLNFNADLHVTQYFRAFAELADDRIFGRRGVPSSTDTDRFDLLQRFVEFRTPGPFGDTTSLRYGREELLFGFQRLIAVREGPNVRRDFDGLQLNETIGSTSIDVLSVRPTVDSAYALDDATNRKQHLGGAYVTTKVAGPLSADFYALDFVNSQAKFRGVTGVQKIETMGVRLFGKANGFDWNLEAADQFGTFGANRVQAHLLAGLVGYTFTETLFTPRLGVSANDASGDNSKSGTIGTFNPLFPRLPYFAETPLLVPANVRDIRPVFSVHPVEKVEAILGYDMLWKASTSDYLYGSAMSQFLNSNKGTGVRIGTELSLDVRWQVNPFLQLGGIIADLKAGPALQEALGKDMIYGVLFAKLKF